MGRSSYRKFMKQERAKVKLKNKDKKLLPKGQNVTDLNFKVKKIVIKTQLKEHQQNEVLSSRKLNIQEVLSRLNHYSGSVSTEAVGQLESLLKSGGRSFLSTHLSSVVAGLAKLLTSLHSHLRKAAIKLLSNILNQVEEGEWSVLRGRLVSHIVCGLSHVEPGVRNDSLLALEALPPTLSLPAESLLPPLLDLVSTSRPAGSRSLSTTLSSSPTAHRAAVLRRIAVVLSSLPSPTQVEEEKKEDIGYSKEDVVRVALVPSYPLLQDQALSISEFNTSTQLSTSLPLDLKEFTSSLVPLMLDSFAEIAPEPNDSEPISRLNDESLSLLGTVADILLLLYDLLSLNSQGCWMRDKLGDDVYKRLIDRRFPYGDEPSSGRKSQQQRFSKPYPLRINLTLAVLTLTLVPKYNSSTRAVSYYFGDVLRSRLRLGPEEAALYQRGLFAILSQPCIYTTALLNSLIAQKRESAVYRDVFPILRKVVLSGTRSQEMSKWLDNLLAELAAPHSDLHQDTLDLLTEAAPRVDMPSTFHSYFNIILGKAVERKVEAELWSVSTLVYWVSRCDNVMLDTLHQLTQLNDKLSPHIIHLLTHKCERYPTGDLCRQLQRHPYWKHMMTPTLSV